MDTKRQTKRFGCEFEEKMHQDPNDFFSKGQYPSGTTRWIGMWFINPFYCGPQKVFLLGYYGAKGPDGKAVDADAVTDSLSGVFDPAWPQRESFELTCVLCDQWGEPEPFGNSMPEMLEDLKTTVVAAAAREVATKLVAAVELFLL